VVEALKREAADAMDYLDLLLTDGTCIVKRFALTAASAQYKTTSEQLQTQVIAMS
jgi:hypothetical protein